MCSQQLALDSCTISAWTGKTIVEIDAEIIAKSNSFSAVCIDTMIQLVPCRRNASRGWSSVCDVTAVEGNSIG
jgi:hypothetical protein